MTPEAPAGAQPAGVDMADLFAGDTPSAPAPAAAPGAPAPAAAPTVPAPVPGPDGSGDSFSETPPGREAAPGEPPPPARDAQGRFISAPAPAGGPVPTRPSSRSEQRKQQIQGDIDRLLESRRLAQQDVEQLEARRRQLTAPAAPAGPAPEPVLEQYLAAGKVYEDWIKDWNRWDRRRELDERDARRDARHDADRVVAVEQAVDREFFARVEAFAASHPDYAEVVGNEDLPALTRPIVQFIRHEDDGPAVAYHLATHPEEIDRIAQYGDTARAYSALGRLARLLETPTAPGAPTNGSAPALIPGTVPRAPLSRAHAPSTPVTGAGPTATKADDYEFGGEFVRRSNDEMKNRGLR